ncbi:GntR family transcriptional regulator of arabinose operon [Caldicellulosiruptor bescii]|uniref:Regulatory protein GntR HTH n=2 Tax=Caldicellulosiruptor bescii TaxID=31899 RepID=B9MMK1_CALBD|nr:GntR family transcriptional regulator [Caldicellulosiruptor bescii]ACM61300.1 regulatory protein GntR HTH [Caldicellulosiruptor bescii DSM 6725]PBC88886.1 GntR family transcriptional regulator of arabinose operon [Caldicellulosiruptor bescii]PBC91632.1 GntR family transcriptional regulator of arabinose operon [Caldicellulosiruptor bescii]PBD02955.1 GntR family transcriptional regulator of arabinose operon [Caldicellulosiruptor bescii]PBD07429.1 GntR family transcriptional regulator of arabi
MIKINLYIQDDGKMSKTKYELIKDFIIEGINSGKFKEGEKIYSENMLARKFKVSRHTVRRAIMELEFEGLLVSLKGRGTFVAKKSADSSKCIAVLTTFISDYIFPLIIRGIEKVIAHEGYGLLLFSTDNSYEFERYHLESIINNPNIDAVIIEPTKSALPSKNLELYKKLIQKDIPVIFINTILEEVAQNYIITKDQSAVYKLTTNLIKNGCKRLFGVFKGDDLQGIKRYRGFEKACKEADVEFDVIFFTSEEYNFVHKRAAEVISRGKFDAAVCYNDKIALPLCVKLKEMGFRIPHDISVTGFDNSLLATLTDIKLTTVEHPKEKLGEMAAKATIAMIKKNKVHVSEEIECEIIYRNSTRGGIQECLKA